MNETGKRLIEEIDRKETAKLDELLAMAEEYIEHVAAGEDATTLPRKQSWYRHPLQPYAQQIVNALREDRGLPANPYSPGGVYAFKAFDMLVGEKDNDGWIPAKRLSAFMRGHRVETILQNRHLKSKGWLLDKTMIRGKVHYRIVKYSEVTGPVTASV